MPWPVYSETFVRTAAQGVATVYTVPAGRRVVVKSVQFVNRDGASGYVFCAVGGIYVVYAALPASIGSTLYNMVAVAYAGQKVETYSGIPNVHQTVSGYLFSEAALLRGRPPDTVEEPIGDRGELVHL